MYVENIFICSPLERVSKSLAPSTRRERKEGFPSTTELVAPSDCRQTIRRCSAAGYYLFTIFDADIWQTRCSITEAGFRAKLAIKVNRARVCVLTLLLGGVSLTVNSQGLALASSTKKFVSFAGCLVKQTKLSSRFRQDSHFFRFTMCSLSLSAVRMQREGDSSVPFRRDCTSRNLTAPSVGCGKGQGRRV